MDSNFASSDHVLRNHTNLDLPNRSGWSAFVKVKRLYDISSRYESLDLIVD